MKGTGQFAVRIPEHDAHLQCYQELAKSVCWALNDLGHDAVMAGPRPDPGFRHIYFGLPLGATSSADLPADAIVYNGEQVSEASIWGHRRLSQVYRGHTIWEYSRTNAIRYSEYGLPAPTVVRPGWCPEWTWSATGHAKTHDLVFFGSSNPRRELLLRRAEALGLEVLRVPFGMYGAVRDNYLKHARLCLNIHFYEEAIFESVRCSHLAAGHLPVLSESSAGDDAHAYSMEGVLYRELLDHAQMFLANPELLATLADTQNQAIRAIPIRDEVGAAIEALDHVPVTHGFFTTVESGPVQASADLPPITLSMIVKNEAAGIEACLGSLKPLLKNWCIVDTGSTDGTQEIIKKFLADVPGQLHELPWKEYDGSRNDALDLARQQCSNEGWLLLIDADEMLVADGPVSIPKDGCDCYDGWVSYCLGCVRWARPLFVRANRPWFYEMPRHEGLYCRVHAPTSAQRIDNVVILSKDSSRDGDAFERYTTDAKVLTKWLMSHPGHARCQYYIAQSYRDAATAKVPFDRASMQQAVTHYLKRATMGGMAWEHHSALIWAADCMDRLGYPWEQTQQRFLEAFNQRPSRAEAIFYVGRHYNNLKQYALGEVFLRPAAQIPITADHTPDVRLEVYQWQAKEELAVALTWLGDWAEARDLNREVLAFAGLPPAERTRIEANLAQCLSFAPDPAGKSD